MPYGEEFRRHRAVIHQLTQPSVLPDYVPLKMEEIRTMLKGLVTTPESYDHHIRRLALDQT